MFKVLPEDLFPLINSDGELPDLISINAVIKRIEAAMNCFFDHQERMILEDIIQVLYLEAQYRKVSPLPQDLIWLLENAVAQEENKNHRYKLRSIHHKITTGDFL